MSEAQPAPAAPPVPRQVPGASIGLSVLAALFYAPMLGILLDAEPTAGGGGEARMAAAFSELFAFFFGFGVWVTVGGLLLIAALHGAMPRWARIPAAVVYALGGIAAAIAIDLVIESAGWVFIVPALLPAIVAAYALWAVVPMAQRILAPQPATVSALAAMAVLVVATIPLGSLDEQTLPDRLAREKARGEAIMAEREAESARLRQQDEDRFQRLTPDSSLWDYINPQLEPSGPDGHERVLRGAREVKTRQQDAVALLRERGVHWLADLWQLEIEATPELCAAYDAALVKEATGPQYDMNIGQDLQRQIPNLKWLGSHNCRPEAGLAAAEAVLNRIVPNNRFDPSWQDFLDLVVALRRPA